ncbi:hypothetical protein WDU94_006868 [Cyamophila willieti]
MSSTNMMATFRLKQDYIKLKQNPIPNILAEPNPADILEWFFVLIGPKDTPYEGGMYLGKLIFPSEFPFKPPSIYMITPTGRFETDTPLCLSVSDFHPETWNPAWTLSSVLIGLLSFLLESTVGSVDMSDEKRRKLVVESFKFNLNNSNFCQLFPELVQVAQDELDSREAHQVGHTASDLEEDDELEPYSPLIGVLPHICFVVGLLALPFMLKYVWK